MRHERVRATAAILAVAALSLAPARPAGAAEPEKSDRIVPPSEYVEDIETPGDSGGVEDEVDAAEAQAEAAKDAAPAPSATPE